MTRRSVLTTTYRFERDSSSVGGFLSGARPSTDALTVVRSWELRGEGRAVEFTQDEDDYLVARTTFSVEDLEQARADLDALCVERGVQRGPVPDAPTNQSEH